MNSLLFGGLALLLLPSSQASFAASYHKELHKLQANLELQRTPDRKIIESLKKNTDLPHMNEEEKTRAVCLGLNAYFEGRGKGEKEQDYINHVALNREKTELWGKGLCGTIYSTNPKIGKKGHGFSWTFQNKDHHPHEEETWKSVIKIAIKSFHEPDPTFGALYYIKHNQRAKWTKNMKRVVIAYHDYYRPLSEKRPLEVASMPSEKKKKKKS